MKKVRPDSKDAILEAAFQVFSEDATAGLGDVADRAGVGRATLHRHFAGRAELMRALAKTAMQELDVAIFEATKGAMDHEEGLRRSLYAIVPLANRQWFLANETFDNDPEIQAAYAASQEEFHAEIEEAKAEGLFDPLTPTVWIAQAYENLVYAAWSVVQAGDATPKQAAELAWRTFATGLKGDQK